MIILPAARSLRTDRRSRLAFYFDAGAASLQPVTGQDVTFTQLGTGTTGSNITPQVGGTVVAGKAQPRFGRDTTLGLNYLELTGTTAGKDQEQLVVNAVLPGRDLTLLLRFTGLWTAGSSLGTPGGIVNLGTDHTQGCGSIRVQRTGTVYRVYRQAVGDSVGVSVDLTEPSSLLWPADLLLTWNNATGIVAAQLRSFDGTTTAPVSAGNSGYITSNARWGGDGFALGSDVAGAVKGAPLRLYAAKIAMGVKGAGAMDGLF